MEVNLGAMHCRRWSIQAGLLAVLSTGAAGQAQAADLPPSPVLAAPPAQSYVPELGNPFWRFFRDGEWFASVGTNKEFWGNSDIRVSQPALGNNFTIYNVQGHDAPAGAGEAPQFNVRVGRFINENWGVEFSLDHSKYYTDIGQTAQVTGLIAGTPTNGPRQLTNTFFAEQLHNGANHVMIDGVYRLPLIGRTNETFSVAGIGKAGLGVMLPHTSDTILGNDVDVGQKTFSNLIGLHTGWWQLNGWTTGAELGFRVVLFKPFYLELTDKVAYSRFDDLPAFQGTLQQSLWVNEVILSLGFTYDGTQ
jgi:hypothetical protein